MLIQKQIGGVASVIFGHRDIATFPMEEDAQNVLSPKKDFPNLIIENLQTENRLLGLGLLRETPIQRRDGNAKGDIFGARHIITFFLAEPNAQNVRGALRLIIKNLRQREDSFGLAPFPEPLTIEQIGDVRIIIFGVRHSIIFIMGVDVENAPILKRDFPNSITKHLPRKEILLFLGHFPPIPLAQQDGNAIGAMFGMQHMDTFAMGLVAQNVIWRKTEAANTKVFVAAEAQRDIMVTTSTGRREKK